ncbi:MAG TPA: phage protease, partial [Cellvibrio sp.]|nr:phage protease [Cellvibrio sp.]
MNTKTPLTVPFAVAACTFGVGRDGINADNEIVMQLTPIGIFKPADDRPLKVPHWHIDKAIATKVIDRFNARKQRVVVDYEHQTLHKEENGQPAPAAGWMRELMWREGEGLFARVKLTKRARAAIEDEEYLFVSPVFRYATNGDVTEIEMAALTNDPGIHGMQALELRAAATFGYHDIEEPTMNKLLAALIATFGLPAATT